jgi:hypothetical protein
MTNLTTDMIRKLFQGRLDDITEELESLRQNQPLPFFYRAVVKDVIFDPLLLTEEEKLFFKTTLHKPFQVDMIPRNSIIAERVQQMGESDYTSELLFPFFSSHLALPIKAGEQVWVFYEGHPPGQRDNGFWISRIQERRDVEDVNFTHSDRRFFGPPKKPKAGELAGVKEGDDVPRLSFPNGLNTGPTLSLSSVDGQDGYDAIYESAAASGLQITEPVPRYTSRPGDLTLQGSNNELINLGFVRTGAADSLPADEEGNVATGQGAIDIVVGRGKPDTPTAPVVGVNTRELEETDKTISASENIEEGNPSFEHDAARIYLAMKMNVDQDFTITLPEGSQEFTLGGGGEGEAGINSSEADKSAIVIKADQIRLIVRKDIKISLEDPDSEDGSNAAAIAILNNGDIAIIPGEGGVVRLGGVDADKAIMVSDQPANEANGNITAAPILTTMGGLVCTSGPATQGTFATKVVIK